MHQKYTDVHTEISQAKPRQYKDTDIYHQHIYIYMCVCPSPYTPLKKSTDWETQQQNTDTETGKETGF